MRRGTLCSIGLLVAIAGAAGAQMGRMPRGYSSGPDYWVGLSYGYLDGVTLENPNSTWQFGYSSQIRATFEKTVQRGVGIGIAAGFATAPLTYSNYLPGAFNSACPGVCQANGDITQAMAFVHSGGGVGFHGMYNLEAGVTEFSNFREQFTGETIQTDSPNGTYDFTFGLGGGVGYGVSPLADIYVGEQIDFLLHSAPPGVNAPTAPRFTTFRIGFRYGF